MSIDTEINSKELFGDKYPTVFFDKVDVYSLSQAGYLDLVGGPTVAMYSGASAFSHFTQHADSEQLSWIWKGDINSDFTSKSTGHLAVGEHRDAMLEEGGLIATIEDTMALEDPSNQDLQRTFDVAVNSCSIYLTFAPDKTADEIESYLSVSIPDLQVFVVYNAWYPFTSQVTKGTLKLYDIFKARDATATHAYDPDQPNYMAILSEEFQGEYQQSLESVISQYGADLGYTYQSSDVQTAASRLAELINLAPQIWAPQIQRLRLGDIINANRVILHETAPKGFIIEKKYDSDGNMIVRIPFKTSFLVPIYTAQQSLMTSMMAFTSYTSNGADGALAYQSILTEQDWKQSAINPQHEEGSPILGEARVFSPSYGETGTGFRTEDSEGDLTIVAAAFLGKGSTDANVWRKLFNSGCGDISYELVTSRGQINSDAQPAYVYATTDEPYSGTVIQAINGKYYATTEGVSQKKLETVLNALIEKYSEFALGNDDLNLNVANLERILISHHNAVNLIPRLGTYRGVYPDKTSTTMSGKFYNEFKKILAKMDIAVKQEKRLKKILTLNPVIEDHRGYTVRAVWAPPVNSEDLDAGLTSCNTGAINSQGQMRYGTDMLVPDTGLREGVGITLPGDLYFNVGFDMEKLAPVYNFIPEAWTTQARLAKLVQPAFGLVSDFMEFLLEEQFGGTGYMADPEAIQAQWFGRETDFWGDQESQTKGNTIVQNSGYWFFDWEKAVSNHSHLGQIFDVTRLNRFLGYKVPYSFFPMEEAHMFRREVVFTTNALTEEDAYSPDGGARQYKLMHFYSTLDTTKPYPMSNGMYIVSDGTVTRDTGDEDIQDLPYLIPAAWTMNTGVTTLEADQVWKTDGYNDTAVASLIPDQYTSLADDSGFTGIATQLGEEYNYMVAAGNEQTAEYVELKHINFDVCNPDPSQRLSTMNTGRIEGGYRLACFQYKDFMDDDVAFHNTLGATAEGPLGPTPSNWTSRYYTSVKCDDRSRQGYADIYGIVKKTYEQLVKYHEIAQKECNFDVVTHAFTPMFKDSMANTYPVPEEHPWAAAAYMYEAMRQVLYGIYGEKSGGSFSIEQTNSVKEAITQAAVRWNHRINPYTGSLKALQRFRYEFLLLLNDIYPQAELNVDSPPPVADAFGEETLPIFRDLYIAGHIDPSMDYTSNPIYEHALNLTLPAGWWDLDGDTKSASEAAFWQFFAGNDPYDQFPRVFSGADPIDSPIYGNLMLSGLTKSDWSSPTTIPFGANNLMSGQIRILIELDHDHNPATDFADETYAAAVEGARNAGILSFAMAGLVDLATLAGSTTLGLEYPDFGTLYPGWLPQWLSGIASGYTGPAHWMTYHENDPEVARKRLQYGSVISAWGGSGGTGGMGGQYPPLMGPSGEQMVDYPFNRLTQEYSGFRLDTVSSDDIVAGTAATFNASHSGLVIDVDSAGFKAKWNEYAHPAIIVGIYVGNWWGEATYHSMILQGGDIDLLTGWTKLKNVDGYDPLRLLDYLGHQVLGYYPEEFPVDTNKVGWLNGGRHLTNVSYWNNPDTSGFEPGPRNQFTFTSYGPDPMSLPAGNHNHGTWGSSGGSGSGINLKLARWERTAGEPRS